MNTRVERIVAGDLLAQKLGTGTWQLSGGSSEQVRMILSGTDGAADEALRGLKASKAVIAWQRGTVLVTLLTAGGPKAVRARTVILHEPLPALYEKLPQLMTLDERARRFWRRVFLLVRIPGGRRLLGLVARRTGSSSRSGL